MFVSILLVDQYLRDFVWIGDATLEWRNLVYANRSTIQYIDTTISFRKRTLLITVRISSSTNDNKINPISGGNDTLQPFVTYMPLSVVEPIITKTIEP